MLLTILLGFLQIMGTTNSSLVRQSQAQAQYYISNIEEGQNLDENLWALTRLTSEHQEVRKFVEHKVQTGSDNTPYLSTFSRIEGDYRIQLAKVVFRSGSPDLLVELLLKTDQTKAQKNLFARFKSQFPQRFAKHSIDYSTLCQHIIQNEPISEKELTTDSFHLVHFFLLYGNADLVPKNYLKQIGKQWDIEKSEQGLLFSLARASLLRTYYLDYQYSKIQSLYNSLVEDKLIPNSSLRLRAYRYLDYAMYRLGYYDRSLNIVRNFAIPISSYLNKKITRLQLKQLQGVYLYSIGKVKAAKKQYQQVLETVNKKNPEIRLSSLYNNMALAYHRLGQYDKYLNMQFQALKIAKRENNYNHEIEIYNNLFIYFRKNNDRKNAIQYLEKALKLAKQNGASKDLGNIYTSLATTYRDFDNNFKKAHSFFGKAENALDPKNDLRNFLHLLNEQAKTYEAKANYKMALKSYNRILKIIPSKNKVDRIDALVNKALNYLHKNRLDIAGKIINKYNSYDLDKLNFKQLTKAKTAEANYLSQTGHRQEAIQMLEPALAQVVVRAKNSADLESGFWHIEDEYLDAFELAVSIYRELGKPGMAVQKLDQLKTINDASLYQNPLVKSSLLNESELTQYKKLTNQLDATRKKLLTASEDEKFQVRQSISQLKLKKRKLDKKLTNHIDSNPISMRQIQNKLSAHELAMHITELKNKYYIARITRSQISLKTIRLDSAKRKLLSGAVHQVATHQTNLNSLYRIAQMLDLNSIPDRIEQVTLIPDSYFYQLPIDILPLDKPTHSYSYGEVTYAIEKFRTQYLTSLEDFQKPKDKIRAHNQLNYVGYGVSNFSGYQKKSLVPLPFAQTEVTKIADRLNNLSNVQTYINNQSTKSTFTHTAPKASIIHLATHSEVSQQDPMFSSIYMSKAGSRSDSAFSDRIFAYELFELNLNNEMIMLNSCESGSGSYIQGTGIMGFSRALQYAGAKSLILNLWSVNDMMASDFAVHFYDQLNQGKSKAEALRNTKRFFLRTKNASPHFWGPYMLIGNAEPVVHPDRSTNLAMAGSFIFYFLLMIGLSYLTQKEFILSDLRDKSL